MFAELEAGADTEMESRGKVCEVLDAGAVVFVSEMDSMRGQFGD